MDLESIRGAWPNVAVSEEKFRAELLRLTDGSEPGAALHAEDLYLAVACQQRDEAALQCLQRMVDEQAAGLHSFNLAPDEKAELAARAMALLVMGPPGGAPKLAQYAARGPLAGWVHVVMTRLLLDDRRERKAKLELDDDALLGASTPAAEPELELLRERFRGQFSAAFRAAMGQLAPRERNLLRQHYLDDLSLHDMGALYRVHRVTVSRWLSQARIALLEKTRNEIATRAGLGRLEVDSVMRVVASRLDLSASLFLGQEVT